MALSWTSTKKKRCRIRWVCACDCGRTASISAYNLRSGNTKSCGCLIAEKLSDRNRSRAVSVGPNLELAVRVLYDVYVRAAQRRGYEFSIGFDRFVKITSLPCDYCGTPPSNFHRVKTSRASPNYGSGVVYSGIDRRDNSVGYTPENSAPCCSVCNRAKHTLGLADFKIWLRRVHKNLFGEAANA